MKFGQDLGLSVFTKHDFKVSQRQLSGHVYGYVYNFWPYKLLLHELEWSITFDTNMSLGFCISLSEILNHIKCLVSCIRVIILTILGYLMKLFQLQSLELDGEINFYES
jgi:hypothetical protein